MRNRQLAHSGMTLVELLVVIAIIGLLLAVSVPLIRPMLESRRTYNAAQVLAGTFQQARMKSIQEGRNYGIKLIPFKTAPTAVLQMRLQKEQHPVVKVNDLDVRVKVENGTIVLYRFYEDQWQNYEALLAGALSSDPSEPARFEETKSCFKQNYKIQFNRIGRFFTIGKNDKLKHPYDNINLPEDLMINDALEYCISTPPITSAWIPQIVMPRSTIVDLTFSGGETVGFDGGNKMADDNDIPAFFSSGDDVVIMFSPAGHVDLLHVNGLPIQVNETLYFCVGEWDRQVDASGDTFAEDGKSNLEAPATYWVTLHPKTGEVRITENAPIQKDSDTKTKKLSDARKFAREHFFNVGGN